MLQGLLFRLTLRILLPGARTEIEDEFMIVRNLCDALGLLPQKPLKLKGTQSACGITVSD